MIIDYSLYDAFLRNPEACRLKYFYKGRGITSKVARDPDMEIGSAAHLAREYRFLGKTIPPKVLAAERISPGAIAVGLALDASLADHEASKLFRKTLWVEREFKLDLGALCARKAKQHWLVGRLDEGVEDKGKLYLVQRKTKGAKSSDKFSFDELWQHNPQADIELIGARSLGFLATGYIVVTTVNKTPAIVHEEMLRRSPEQLATTALNVYQVARIIEMLLIEFGADTPWPHASFCYPCNYGNKCELKNVCKKSNLTRKDLANFQARREHLSHVKEKRG